MSPNVGNNVGMGPMDAGSHMPGQGPTHPPATEYTLQGVMRFLQTEWHRHERDRNAWEIERQEMRGRIATLEGQQRRADATQKALRKYVGILETKVKNQAAQLKGSTDVDAVDTAASAQSERAAKIQEKLKATSDKLEDTANKPDDENQRQDLKTFLDQCQSEFMYLMITPTNPQPPRESPPLPLMEDLREVEAFGAVTGSQSMERQYPIHQRQPQNIPPQGHGAMQQAPLNFHPKSDLLPQPMVRSTAEHQPLAYHNINSNNDMNANATSNDWAGSVLATHGPSDGNPDVGHGAGPPAGRLGDALDLKDKTQAVVDNDAWEFPDGPLSDTNPAQPPSNRPDTDVFPTADNLPKSPNRIAGSHRRKGSMSKRRGSEHDTSLQQQKIDNSSFKLRFGLRGHLDIVRTVIFSGGGSPGEPEICTAGDDGMIKRFNIPRLDGYNGQMSSPAASDLDVIANFTHRGHAGAVLSLTSWSPAPNFSTGGRAQGDGWIFSGGQDATIRVWERGRVDPKATLEGHTDAVWALCVLPATLGSVFGGTSPYGSTDRILLVSGAADGSVRLWSVSAPPQLSSPQPGSNRGGVRGGGRVRGNSMSSGSGFTNTPQPTMSSNSPFHHTLIHNISRSDGSRAGPTSITPLGTTGESFVVSYSDAAVVVYDTRTGEHIGLMDSMETYDGSIKTSINAIVATTVTLDQAHHPGVIEEENSAGGPTGGGRSMVEGTIISGHEDRFVRFFDANSGQCTYNMLAHPDAISSLSLSPDGLELVSVGHDASLRFWNLEKRTCTQEMTSHRVMRGEGVCAVVWSQDGKWVVSGGGDGIVKVFAR